MSKRREGRKLAAVDPQGRVDVLMYRLVLEGMQRLEREHGLIGLAEHLGPVLEEFLIANVPQQNLIPREIQALLRVCEANRGRAS